MYLAREWNVNKNATCLIFRKGFYSRLYHILRSTSNSFAFFLIFSFNVLNTRHFCKNINVKIKQFMYPHTFQSHYSTYFVRYICNRYRRIAVNESNRFWMVCDGWRQKIHVKLNGLVGIGSKISIIQHRANRVSVTLPIKIVCFFHNSILRGE